MINDEKIMDATQRLLSAEDGILDALVAPLLPLPEAAPPGPYTS